MKLHIATDINAKKNFKRIENNQNKLPVCKL